jgi:hypothetical protein
MLNDYILLQLSLERQAQVRRDVADGRRVAKMLTLYSLTLYSLLTAFFTTTIVAAYSGDRTGLFSGVVVDDRNRPVSGAVVLLSAITRRCTAKTDGVGRFAVACVAGGGYTARVHKDGFTDTVLPNVGTIVDAVVDVGAIPLTHTRNREAAKSSSYGRNGS